MSSKRGASAGNPTPTVSLSARARRVQESEKSQRLLLIRRSGSHLSPSCQQSRAFDGTCQGPPGLGGWSSLVRQLSARQSSEKQRLLHVLFKASKQDSRVSTD
ncbi:hypothetical protein NQZ68_032365 [Dissostichus eleginoides]|nr:hypothetical protein NQZ68_032365 [Dissostichus eleginoides]